eukprot:CAMPEP_0194042934 /NCGR_PEP_ID=MMETSP0009_2-20130614/14652_1 /TAXON_ID=210454 /ORGANISM="Grammatophora oceanica, Strain CCMP 410" /LENGTH=125 /DNA_ID=CAMNT_0038686973 /DNA_START=157 /DNA_END=530 /DNA_ORIENTATION=+
MARTILHVPVLPYFVREAFQIKSEMLLYVPGRAACIRCLEEQGGEGRANEEHFLEAVDNDMQAKSAPDVVSKLSRWLKTCSSATNPETGFTVSHGEHNDERLAPRLWRIKSILDTIASCQEDHHG